MKIVIAQGFLVIKPDEITLGMSGKALQERHADDAAIISAIAAGEVDSKPTE